MATILCVRKHRSLAMTTAFAIALTTAVLTGAPFKRKALTLDSFDHAIFCE